MRILAIFPRVTRTPAGGSEHFFDQLCGALRRHGAEVDCLTTTTRDLAPSSSLGIRWDREGDGAPPGIPRPTRFRTINLPGRISRRLSAAALDAAVDRELPFDEPGRVVASGLFPEEIWGDGGFPFRWSGRRFALQGHRGPALLEALAPLPGSLTVQTPRARVEIPLRPGRFHRYEIPDPAGARATFTVSRLFAPPGDVRALGVAIRGLARDGEEARALEPPSELDEARRCARLSAEAARSTLREEMAHALLRGPLAPGLAWSALRRAESADLVLAGSAPFLTMDLAVAAGRLCARPVALVPFLHLADPWHHLRRITRTLAAADLVFALTENGRAWLEGAGCRAELPPGGLDPAEFPGDDGAAGRQAREELGIAPAERLFLWVGRAGGAKRLDRALDALAIARRSAPLRLVACGPGTERVAAEGAQGLGLVPRSRLLALYAGADALLHTSEEESLGLVLLEAWASGRPVIVNPLCGASRELVRDGVDGLHAASAADVAAAMMRLAADGEASRERLGGAGRARALAGHTWEAGAEVAMRAFRALLAA